MHSKIFQYIIKLQWLNGTWQHRPIELSLTLRAIETCIRAMDQELEFETNGFSRSTRKRSLAQLSEPTAISAQYKWLTTSSSAPSAVKCNYLHSPTLESIHIYVKLNLTLIPLTFQYKFIGVNKLIKEEFENP